MYNSFKLTSEFFCAAYNKNKQVNCDFVFFCFDKLKGTHKILNRGRRKCSN